MSEIPGFRAAERAYENTTDETECGDGCPFCAQDNDDQERWDD